MRWISGGTARLKKGAAQRTWSIVEPGRRKCELAQFIKFFVLFMCTCIRYSKSPGVVKCWISLWNSLIQKLKLHKSQPSTWQTIFEIHFKSKERKTFLSWLVNLQQTFTLARDLNPLQRFCKMKHLKFSPVDSENRRRRHCFYQGI